VRAGLSTSGRPRLISSASLGRISIAFVGLELDMQTAQASAPEASAVIRQLLFAYADTLEIVEGLPSAPLVSTGWHLGSRPIRLPRVRWMLHSLTVWHIDRVLSGAERMFHRRSALGIAGAGEADALGAVREFRGSLPSRSRALRLCSHWRLWFWGMCSPR
jgi:hypothetical protein